MASTMTGKANKEAEVTDGGGAPLVHYRKKDAERIRQIDAMQDDVASKIGDVMASFKDVPSRTEQLEKTLLKSRASHVQQISMPARKYINPASYVIMAFLSAVLIIALFCFTLF